MSSDSSPGRVGLGDNLAGACNCSTGSVVRPSSKFATQLRWLPSRQRVAVFTLATVTLKTKHSGCLMYSKTCYTTTYSLPGFSVSSLYQQLTNVEHSLAKLRRLALLLLLLRPSRTHFE